MQWDLQINIRSFIIDYMGINLLERLSSILKPSTEYGCKRNDGDLSSMYEEGADVPEFPWPPDRNNTAAVSAWEGWLKQHNLPPLSDKTIK